MGYVLQCHHLAVPGLRGPEWVWQPMNRLRIADFGLRIVQQMTEDGLQRSEVGGRRSEVGGRRSEVGGRRSEVGGWRTEVGGQRSEVGIWTRRRPIIGQDYAAAKDAECGRREG
jgi:hypothetical protein